MTLHILKLCVGCESVEDLADWQAERARLLPGHLPRHVTRMWPKQAEAVLDGGSLYWVIKGSVQVRQRILRLDPVEGEDGITRCALVLDPELVRTEPAPRRPSSISILKSQPSSRSTLARTSVSEPLFVT